ncbi:MAG: DUF4038 domain-containing protein, partial [Streptococcaceae bacterium]|nr:DUF4038 domain-containing protein [Streptococcaceae bacterium]
SQLDDSYFERAERMCAMAEENGFSLALVVLWSNYVSGTWASELDQQRNVFPDEYLMTYFEQVLKHFDKFHPIYVIGGDTDFQTDKATQTYKRAFEFFRANSKETLKTIHIRGRLDEIPDELIDEMDLYFYQSGHNSSFLDMPYLLAEKFYGFDPKMPIINSEPCYEQMGFSRKVYGRFSQKDVRRAAWQSILSGACAGITYGAHGIWSWHDAAAGFNSELGEAFDSPMFWQDALYLPGADDYGYLKQFLELTGTTNLIPRNDLLLKGDAAIRVAQTEDESACFVYIPSNTSIILDTDLSDFLVTLVNLSDNHFYMIEYEVKDGKTYFSTHTSQEDALIFAKKGK